MMLCLLPYIGGQKLGEISKSWRPKTCQDSRRDLKILVAKDFSRFSQKTGRDSRRDLKISAAKKLTENLGKTLSKILSRYQNFGGQKISPAMLPRYLKMSRLGSR